jgi:two-component system sensor histidine kinase KdpD
MVAVVGTATVLSWLMFPYVSPATLIMTYLLGVVVVATRYGRGLSVLASAASVASFDFFFVPPHLTFVVADTQEVLTFAVMLVVALVISGLTARIRRQAEASRQREQWTAALYAMSGALARASAVDDLVASAARQIADVFDAEVTVLLRDAAGRLAARGVAGGATVLDQDLETSRAVIESRRPAGLGTDTGRSTGVAYLPLLGHPDPLGVVCVRPRRRDGFRSPDVHRQLETFVNQAALALERIRLAAEAQDARVRAETERLRSALLTSVSHDLRTPLAAITGAATTMLSGGPPLEPRVQRELLESVRDEAERLSRLVQDLLQMTRLESGALQFRRDWHPIEEVVGAALGRLARPLAERRVFVNIPPDLPLVPMDDVLIEQALFNVLENAVKHTPPDSAIRIIATATLGRLTIEIADHGPGLPRGQEDRVFEKFYRAGSGARQGAGLGLAICRAIVEAHGGRIRAHNLPEGGVAFLLTLPIDGAPPAAVPADA